MNDPAPSPRLRFWGWLTVVGLLAYLVTSAFTYAHTASHPALRPGQPVPPVTVTTAAGTPARLDSVLSGRSRLLVVAPTCDICAAEMQSILAGWNGEPGADRDDPPPSGMFFLILQTEAIPRATFMDAYRQLRGTEAGIALIPIEEGRLLGITRVPAAVRLDPGGRVGAITYLQEAQEP
jgi:hypothetical protein